MTLDMQIYEKLETLKVGVNLMEVCELDLSCKSILKCNLENTVSITPNSMIKVQAVIDYMYEQVNVGNWKEVRLFLRKTITIASYVKLLIHIKCAKDAADEILREAFKIIDFGILFGCPLTKEPNLLQKCAVVLNSELKLVNDLYTNSNIASKIVKEDKINEENHHKHKSLEILDRPSMEHFYKNYILTEKPVILDNCMEQWPALTKWKDQDYFIKLAGLRTVSIEVGSKYTDSDWTQKLMTMEEFIKDHIYQTNGPTGYLAQYQLFQQIPELKEDIMEPEYCCFSDSNEPVDVMAWYGPKGTVSPIHHDPKRNLLAQVIGEKQLFLFSPSDSEYLYPHEHKLLNNTAQIDPREPDLEKFPKYKNAKGYYCILKPGQMLYIPPKWWHFVQSLSISFSVSFWWE